MPSVGFTGSASSVEFLLWPVWTQFKDDWTLLLEGTEQFISVETYSGGSILTVYLSNKIQGVNASNKSHLINLVEIDGQD